jgi:hypothetical protein
MGEVESAGRSFVRPIGCGTRSVSPGSVDVVDTRHYSTEVKPSDDRRRYRTLGTVRADENQYNAGESGADQRNFPESVNVGYFTEAGLPPDRSLTGHRHTGAVHRRHQGSVGRTASRPGDPEDREPDSAPSRPEAGPRSCRAGSARHMIRAGPLSGRRGSSRAVADLRWPDQT